jgi:hypothetical protein
MQFPAPAVILVSGTWGAGYGRNRDWWRPGSEFSAMLTRGGYPLLSDTEPFVWSTNVDGVGALNLDWETAGWALKWYVEAKAKRARPSVIAHSHGGQVVAYAAAAGARFDAVLTVATPVRQDLDGQYRDLRAATRQWVHISTDEKAGIGWQLLGAIGIRTAGQTATRAMPLAHKNIFVPGYSHGELVERAALWLPEPDGKGWRDLLRTVPPSAPPPTTANLAGLGERK